MKLTTILLAVGLAVSPCLAQSTATQKKPDAVAAPKPAPSPLTPPSSDHLIFTTSPAQVYQAPLPPPQPPPRVVPPPAPVSHCPSGGNGMCAGKAD